MDLNVCQLDAHKDKIGILVLINVSVIPLNAGLEKLALAAQVEEFGF